MSVRQEENDPARRNTRARFEQWAQNPSCQANIISAVHNVRMADVARSEGYASSFGQSPFALARGQTFERMLLRNDARILIEELIRTGVLIEGAKGLADFRIRANGGPLRTLDDAIAETRSFLASLIKPPGSVPSLVAGATVRIPRGVMLPEAILILDVVAVLSDGSPVELAVGEVKTYPDRGGHTDSKELAVARAQAGLYVHALQLIVAELGIEQSVTVLTDGFLILTRPGSNRPAVRAGWRLGTLAIDI